MYNSGLIFQSLNILFPLSAPNKYGFLSLSGFLAIYYEKQWNMSTKWHNRYKNY